MSVRSRIMKIAIMGFGTVGSGTYEVLKSIDDVEVVRILARHGREGYDEINPIITSDIADITSNPDIDLVVESIGGIEPAREYVLACMKAGKHVVTPNKNLVSACYDELKKAAAENGVSLRFSAAAGGGIPWLYNLARTKRCDTISSIYGIVNGTCNYILHQMFDNNLSFAEVLAKAQKKGIAEADPSSDIEGTDTLRKTVISANLAFDADIKEEDVPCYGIDTIDVCDIEWFKAHGYTCRLIMNAKVISGESGATDTIVAYVEPTMYPANAIENNIKRANNFIALIGRNIGVQCFYGQGAGQLVTGESVVQDILDIRDGIDTGVPYSGNRKHYVVDSDSEVHRYYIRHDKMCEHIEPMIDSYEYKNGIYYCISKPITVTQMHAMGQHRKEKGRTMFFAGIDE